MRPTLCYVASYDPGYARNVDVVRALRRAGARVELVRVRRAHRGTPGLLRAAARFAAKPLLPFDVALRLLRCHAVVIGYFGQPDMLLLAPLAMRLGRPVVFNPLVTLTDTLVEDRKLVPAGGLLARLVESLDRRALQLANLVLVDTPENADFIARCFGVDRERIVVFPVGVDGRIFYPRAPECSERRDGELDVLFYGKFIPLHGVDTIVEAASIVERRAPAIRFELIGRGQTYPAARALAERLGVGNIEWTGWLPYDALGDRLRRADVALGVFSGGSKAARVIPNKVHQALACGVPLITRRGPAVERLLVDGESALLVPPDDPAALAEALLRLAADPALRSDLGERGRRAWVSYASDDVLRGHAEAVLQRLGVAC